MTGWAARKRAGLPTRTKEPVVDPDLPTRLKNNEYERRHRLRHPKRYRARDLVRALLAAGVLKKPTRCEVRACRMTDVHAHHPDHNRPLEWNWVCAEHHRLAHRGEVTLPPPRPRLLLPD